MFPFSVVPGSGVAALTRDRGGFLLARLQPKFRKRPRLVFLEREEGEDAAALQRLVRRARIGRIPCVFLLPPSDYLILTTDAPPVPVPEQAAALRWQIKDRLPYPLEEAVVEPFSLPEGSGGAPQMGAVATHRHTVRETAQLLRRAGARLAVIDVPELAWLNLLPLLDDPAQGIALLHLEPEGGVLAMVAREGRLYVSRRIEAPGWASPSRLERLAQEVQRTLDYCEHRFRLPQVAELLVCGAAPDLAALPHALADRLGVRARLLPITECFAVECAADPFLLLRHLPLLGAALRPLEAP